MSSIFIYHSCEETLLGELKKFFKSGFRDSNDSMRPTGMLKFVSVMMKNDWNGVKNGKSWKSNPSQWSKCNPKSRRRSWTSRTHKQSSTLQELNKHMKKLLAQHANDASELFNRLETLITSRSRSQEAQGIINNSDFTVVWVAVSMSISFFLLLV